MAETVRIAVEAASPFGWERYVGPAGAIVGMRGFGASAPAKDLYAHFGITADAVVAAAKARFVERSRRARAAPAWTALGRHGG